MGEYAEMMLDGTCCAGCGEYMGDGYGFATYCSAECARDHGAEYHGACDSLTLPNPKPHKCDQCKRSFATAGGLAQHKEVKHAAPPRTCPGCGKKVKGGDRGMRMHMEAKGCKPQKFRPISDFDDDDVLESE